MHILSKKIVKHYEVVCLIDWRASINFKTFCGKTIRSGGRSDDDIFTAIYEINANCRDCLKEVNKGK